MRINSNNNVSFRGYDARPLEYIILRNSPQLNSFPLVKQLQKIGDKSDFKVIWEGAKVIDNIPTETRTPDMIPKNLVIWLQDNIHVLKNKILAVNTKEDDTSINEYFGLRLSKVAEKDFIQGGNMFFIRNGKQNKVLIGEDEDIAIARKLFRTKNIIQIPQADFHLDMFLRPLKDGNVLVTDDNMTLDILGNAVEKLSVLLDKKALPESYGKSLGLLTKCYEDMRYARRNMIYENTEEVIKALSENGFNPIRVPGRIYRVDADAFRFREGKFEDFSHSLNYMNAIVQEKSNGDLVYITNKSHLAAKFGIKSGLAKLLGLNFEDNFISAIKHFIQPENIHFVNGGTSDKNSMSYLLSDKCGGLHCLCAEVPKGMRKENSAKPFDVIAF